MAVLIMRCSGINNIRGIHRRKEGRCVMHGMKVVGGRMQNDELSSVYIQGKDRYIIRKR